MLKVSRYPALVAIAASLFAFFSAPASAQPAPDANSVLVLTSVDGGGSYSAAAAAAGFTVVPATDAQWAARSTADFATFRALIIGDPSCGGTPPAAAEGNAATWSAAINGPKLIIGTDERFHFGSGGSTLITSGVAFVTSGGPTQTGVYISLSCYYDSAPTTTPVPLLAGFGSFTVSGTGGGCFNDSHVVASSPALAGSTDTTLSNWSCSVHEVFRAFPSASLIPLAIARGITGTGSMTFADGSFGVPYILASGGGLVPIGTAVAVPTMSEWTLISMAVLLTLVAAIQYRRRRR